MKNFHRYYLSAPPFFPQKKGVLIEWEDGRWSEAAPLPGWSQETLEEVEAALTTASLPPPSLAFALDARTHTAFSVPVCALLAGSREQIERDAIILEKAGFRHAKLKLSNFSFHEAIDITEHLAHRFLLRLDFNRSLTLDQALSFAKRFKTVDFYEEPLKNPRELRHFPYPLALDESLREKQHENLINLPHIKTFVIKPTMMGPLSHWQHLLQLGKEIVLSSSFESGVGILQIMHLAKELESAPLGIDTYRFLEEDVLENPIVFKEGMAHAPQSILVKLNKFVCKS